MPGKYSVLNQPAFQDELKKLNKKVYNKRHRLGKNYGVQVDLQNKRMDDFKNKREYDAWKKEVMMAADRKSNVPVKNQNGTVLDLDTVKKTKQLLDRANKEKQARLQHYMKQPFLDRGQPTGFTLGDVEYGFMSEKFGSLQPTKWNPDRFNSEKELMDFYREKSQIYAEGFLEKRDQQYLNNYIESLNQVFGSGAEDIMQHLKGMSPKEFIDLYYTENLVNVEFIYSRRDAALKLQTIRKQFKIS